MRTVDLIAAVAAPLAAAALSTAAWASKPAGPALQREPTTEERDSFDAFFSARQAATPQGPWATSLLFAPGFEIDREAAGKPWRVIARVDSAPRRSHPDLCRQLRSSFVYDAAGSAGRRWQEAAEPPRWYVWLATPTVPCAAARYTTLQDPKVANADAVALLRRHRDLLGRARLLFAGNSKCAPYRSLTYRLAALEPAPSSTGTPLMLGMVFESDRGTVARVAVRKSRGDYTAWNVSCAGRTGD